MLQRTKSARNRKSSGRCSDGDSSANEAPVFASVHRARHNGAGSTSAARRDGPQKATACGGHQQRQSYHQYQQQRKLQHQLQQQQQQQQQQQSVGNENSSAAQKLAKTTRNWNEQQQQLQQPSTVDTAPKQSIAVSMPQSLVAATAVNHGRPAMQQINANGGPQRDVSPTKASRIPLQQQQHNQVQPNFNQISKTATNLLNDIYERHLLNQTTFQAEHSQERPHQSQQQPQQQQQQANKLQQQPQLQPRHHLQQHRFLAARQVGQEVELNFASSSAQYQQQQQRNQQHAQQSPRHFLSFGNQQAQQHHSFGTQEGGNSALATFVPIHGSNKQHVAQKPVHFLKLPPPPPLAAPPSNAGGQNESVPPKEFGSYTSYQQHFQFSDAYVEPVDSRKHFLLQSDAASTANPPPPPAPLNHVYETIKERPPMPPPKNARTAEAGGEDEAPPLPPSRQLRKRLVAAAAKVGSNKRTTTTANTNGSQSKMDAGQLGGNGKLNSKLLPMQPPAYVAPPAAGPAKQSIPKLPPQQQQQYNPQQRTKADGEQRPYLYQQLRERQQQQASALKTTAQRQPQHHLQQQQQQHQRPNHPQVREHPLGAHADQHGAQKLQSQPQQQQFTNTNNSQQKPVENMITQSAVALTTTKATVHATSTPSAPPTTANSNSICATSIDVSDSSVELMLQQAGLLHSHATSLTAHSGGGGGGANKAPQTAYNNNANHTGGIGNNNSNNISNLHPTRPTALPIVFEEDTGEFQDVLVLEEDGTAKLPYRHGKIEVRLETAQAMAAAAYYARAAQKLAQTHNSTKSRTAELPNASARNGGFCGALQRAPPPMPPGLARRLANKENYGIGKVKVMLRVSDAHTDAEHPHFMAVDKKKRQVTLTDPSAASAVAASTSQERGPMVAAPKMFAFDSLFTAEDQQSDICASALSEVIPAVLEGSDGCLLTIGYPNSGQPKTMLGGVNPPTELGAIPCAISWLYKGINERRQKSGARFSVRVSALGVSATKPDSSSKDLLAAHATESDDSPGVYLRDDFLGGPTELRAPTAERAALFLDAALAGRPQGGLEPAMIFTLHVYQYSLSRKGGVAGGRSRLHLIDLGGCANRNGGLPLSGIGNILLAILSGQRHPPNKDHPLTPLLKDCLAPLTCHVAIMAHVMHTQSHTDALTTIQLASRIHRMRRRKHRFPMPSDKTGVGGLAGGVNGGHQSTGSSAGSGADPSSSELSADTVIYMGPSDDATDGEHPPVYLPSLSSGDNRCVMSKALKGSGLEKQQQSPAKSAAGTLKKTAAQKVPQSPTINASSRNGSLKRGHVNSPIPAQQQQQSPQVSTANADQQQQQQFFSPVHSTKSLTHSASSPKIVGGSLRHPGMAGMMCSKGSNVPSPKGSPLRRPGVGGGASVVAAAADALDCPGSPMRKISEEQWIDGPRVSRAKVAEARHLMREVNHVKQCETWIDGPKSQSARSLTAGNLPTAPSQVQGYGFMDSHKKSMIRQWVENQTSQVFQSTSAASSPTHGAGNAAHRDQQAQHLRNITYHMSQLKQKSLDAPEDLYATSTRQLQHQQHSVQQPQLQQQHSLPLEQQFLLCASEAELAQAIAMGLSTAVSTTNASAPAEIRGSKALYHQRQSSATGSLGLTQQIAKDETDLHSTHSHTGYGTISQQVYAHGSAAASEHGVVVGGQQSDRQADCDEDQDSGPSEVPPALPLIEPLGSREISHESLHRILSRHVSRESLYQQQQQREQQQELRRHEELQQNAPSRQSSHHFSQHSMGMSDCGLQVTEEEIARTMGGEHPLAALSHVDNMSIVSSFNMAGDAFSDCAMGERTRNQFDQLARLREIFTSQLAMAEVTPVFRSCDVGSVYSEPAYRFNTGPGSVCSEPPYRPPSPRQPSRSPSQGSLPSLNGIMQIAGMEQYASLRHPDGASDPNLPKVEKPFVLEHEDICEVDEKSALLSPSKRPSLEKEHLPGVGGATVPTSSQTQLPLLPLNTSCEAYDSGHDSSTPRTSKHSGISRRAESGYHSVATARDSDESSFTSGLSKEHHNRITMVKKKRQDKGLCNWLMNPFTCTYPETEGEISDF
ncbi:kinesin-like protein GA13060 isoform X1 [Bactrocera neohumeralis]|uniref:kinesin-like protein GA13060 isoform X1 n=1 Tax=Bactrocera neohumeralis TaxID=98809 RepID=UPI002165C649|nr:kinesin-like protein GA13060 isoform X1 [Bactrocera neohumeralis]